MTVLQNWAVGLCVTAIGFSLFEMLAPAGRVKKVLQLLTAVSFFCCLITPLREFGELAGGLFDGLDSTSSVSEELTQTAQQQAETALETVLLQDANDRLAVFGIAAETIEIKRDTSRADSIYIEQVTVIFPKEEYPIGPDVAALLEQAWGVPAEVHYVD